MREVESSYSALVGYRPSVFTNYSTFLSLYFDGVEGPRSLWYFDVLVCRFFHFSLVIIIVVLILISLDYYFFVCKVCFFAIFI